MSDDLLAQVALGLPERLHRLLLGLHRPHFSHWCGRQHRGARATLASRPDVAGAALHRRSGLGIGSGATGRVG